METLEAKKNIRACGYNDAIFSTKSGHIVPDITNFATWFPAGLVVWEVTATWFLKAYDSGNSDWSEVPVWILAESVSTQDYADYDESLSWNVDWTDGIRVVVDFGGKFVKANLTGWDANAATELEATELENWTVVQF